MEHDLNKGLVHFTSDEMKILHEMRTPIDERAISHIVGNLEYTIDVLKKQAEAAVHMHEIGLEGAVPFDEVAQRYQESIEKKRTLLPKLAEIAFDVEAKWQFGIRRSN